MVCLRYLENYSFHARHVNSNKFSEYQVNHFNSSNRALLTRKCSKFLCKISWKLLEANSVVKTQLWAPFFKMMVKCNFRILGPPTAEPFQVSVLMIRNPDLGKTGLLMTLFLRNILPGSTKRDSKLTQKKSNSRQNLTSPNFPYLVALKQKKFSVRLA